MFAQKCYYLFRYICHCQDKHINLNLYWHPKKKKSNEFNICHIKIKENCFVELNKKMELCLHALLFFFKRFKKKYIFCIIYIIMSNGNDFLENLFISSSLTHFLFILYKFPTLLFYINTKFFFFIKILSLFFFCVIWLGYYHASNGIQFFFGS